jgi:hypothetical protein
MNTQYPVLGAKPLLTISKCALEQTQKAVLKDFCSKYDLVVGCSGKKLQDSLKKDYVEAIQEYVSDWSSLDRKG